MSSTLSQEKIEQLQEVAKKMKYDLEQQHIKVGYKIMPDMLLFSVDLESLVEAMFWKYPNLYRQYDIIKNKYIIIEVR